MGTTHERFLDPTLSESWRTFIQYRRAFRLKHPNGHTRDQYGRALCEFTRWAFDKGLDPLHCSLYDIRQYFGVLQGRLKLSSAGNHISALRSFYQDLHERQIVNANWWAAFRVPKDNEIRHSKPIAEDRLREMYIRAGCLGNVALLLLRLMYEAGLRREDVVKIRRADLKPDDPALWVHGRGGAQLVAIPTELASWIRAELDRIPDSPWLFPGYKGMHLSTRHVNRILKQIDPGLHPHRCRVTHMQTALEIGFRAEDIGHTLQAAPQTVLNHEGPLRRRRVSTVGLHTASNVQR